MKLSLKTIIAAGMAAICIGAFGACSAGKDARGDEKIEKDTRRVEYFAKLDIAAGVEVRFAQGKTASLRLEGTRSKLDNIDIKQDGDRLSIRQKGVMHFNLDNSPVVVVYLTSPDITDINIIGAGDFRASTDIDTDNLSVGIQGSGDVALRRVVCDGARFDIRGSGDITAEAIDCKEAALGIKGSGDMTMRSLKAQSADVQVRGSGDVDAWLKGVATTSIDVTGSGDVDIDFDHCGHADCKVKGSGDVELSGTLATLSKSHSGSGEISTDKLMLKR